MTLLLYLLFFLSGAAALVYEVVWVRSLSLVFGGSHLAVTTVLSVFMGGLALGGFVLGRRADRSSRPLRLYGLLEIGVGLSAASFGLAVRHYDVLYVPLARLGETSVGWLSLVRVALAVAGMIVPTTLMGGTLPVLFRCASARSGGMARPLALLYGVNTLGAVAGALGAGFVLLRGLGASRTLAMAVGTNLLVGLTALLVPAAPSAPRAAAGAEERPSETTASRLVAWGIGVSGFCALGYEVLWTRVLSMAVGTSVYSFTIMLVSFLSGIGIGSQALLLLPRGVRTPGRGGRSPAVAFAVVETAIGLSAFATTYALRDLPGHAMRLQGALLSDTGEFAARQGASFLLAFAFMAGPAFFMGLAFPLAGLARAGLRRGVGGAVGETLAANTIGAIAGAAASGFVLIHLFGIERSLQMLSIVSVGVGLVVAATVADRLRRPAVALAVAAVLTSLVAVAALPDWSRTWDRKLLAVFRNNQREAFATEDRIRDALRNTDVLYYHEGLNETISVIRPKGSQQAFIVNGRSEATTAPEDVQCQRTLGHLPMLAHPSPRRVFVLGLGTGMTLGATSTHPEVESITLAEIETGVFGAARTFAEFNHGVLDDPRLRIVHDDGRNFLRTTRETFDVITADPIHPWSGGASYLYTTEYFGIARRRLSPGGVICQWLPIYELTPDDLRCVVRTFADSFRHVALWLTDYDAELLGSDRPLRFDETEMARRFANPEVARDLAAVDMGSPRDFLSYMLAGDAGVRAFGRGGARNTDDNLRLEFSSPRSQGVPGLVGSNILALAAHRESPVPYLTSTSEPFWRRMHAVGSLYDRAHALARWNRFDDPELLSLLDRLRRTAPDHAPARFLERRRQVELAATPRPIDVERFAVLEEDGRPGTLEITAVAMRVGTDRGVVVFADNALREIYGQRYVDAPDAGLDARLASVAREVLAGLRAEYARGAGGSIPTRRRCAGRLRAVAPALAGEGP